MIYHNKGLTGIGGHTRTPQKGIQASPTPSFLFERQNAYTPLQGAVEPRLALCRSVCRLVWKPRILPAGRDGHCCKLPPPAKTRGPGRPHLFGTTNAPSLPFCRSSCAVHFGARVRALGSLIGWPCAGARGLRGWGNFWAESLNQPNMSSNSEVMSLVWRQKMT